MVHKSFSLSLSLSLILSLSLSLSQSIDFPELIDVSYAIGGVGIFFKGWRVWFSRIAPHAVLSLVFLDWLTSVQKDYDRYLYIE